VLCHGGTVVRSFWCGNAIRRVRRMLLFRFWWFVHRWSTRGSVSGPCCGGISRLHGGDGLGNGVLYTDNWCESMKSAAAVSPERIAALEILFSGVRRVHALGSFYRLPQREKALDCPKCPECGEKLPLNLRAWHRSERRSVASLEAEGRRDYRAVASAIRRARVFGARAPCSSCSWESLSYTSKW
jgi:hypothetical protein